MAVISDISIEDLFNYRFHHFHWSVITSFSLLLTLAIIYILRQPRPVYLVDFSCYKPGDEYKTTREFVVEHAPKSGFFTQESLEFQEKVFEKSGIGEETYVPKVFFRIPFDPHLVDAIEEVETLMFGALDDLFAKTNFKPRDIGILVVNCGNFSPTPSLSAMIVNRYKLRSNIMSYNIAGMGCSAGVISIDLAKNLLQVHKNSYALAVTVESGTLSSYTGNEKCMLVSNCLFRMGVAAILLSNKRSDRRHSKYQLLHIVRTHKGADDESFHCIEQREDSEGNVGFALSKRLTIMAGDALKENIVELGRLVLPFTQKFGFAVTKMAKKMFKNRKINRFVFYFKLAFEHFCVHAGGRAVLDGVQKNLLLTDWLMEPSRMTLYRFGNTSSSSIWYELAYSEAKGRVKRGDRVWQISFGAGFKCNGAVWRALRSINPAHEQNVWMDEINSFPVQVAKA